MKNLIAAIIVLGVAADANAQSATAVMERASKRYADMTSMSADFRQTITNPLTGTSAASRGTLLRKDPNLLSITFSDPRGDRIVSDGTNLWVYLPSSAPGRPVCAAITRSANSFSSAVRVVGWAIAAMAPPLI